MERTEKQEAVMADEPRKITLPGGRPAWQWPDGRIHPEVSGGIDDGDEGDDDTTDADDSDDGADDDKRGDDVEAMKKALKKANKEAETARKKVKEYEDATKSEQEKLTESLSEAEKRAETASLTALRYEVALDKGIPKSIASRLQGTTREELETDAAELLETITGDKPTPSFDGGAKDKDAPGSGSFLTQAMRNKRSS